MNFSEIDLPVSLYLKKITETLFEKGAMILIAAPGAGKSTLVPCAILNALKNSNEKILLVQPRRVAARSVTDRIADLLGERIGERAGLRTRTETIVSKETRIEVVTDGVLVRILQHDPSLEGFSVVMFDEFHERSIQADLSLAFLWDLRRSIRKDLKVIFMSATPDSRRIIETLGDMPIIDVPGKTFPVETEYRAVHDEKKICQSAAASAVSLLSRTDGDVLVFLPGWGEIVRTEAAIREKNPDLPAEIVPLHGSISPDLQKRAVSKRDSAKRRIILSTNIAETSVTIPA